MTLSHVWLALFMQRERRERDWAAHALERVVVAAEAPGAGPVSARRYGLALAHWGALSRKACAYPTCDTGRMNELRPPPEYKRQRFPSEIIACAVRLYFRVPLSYRDAEDLLAERGVEVPDESIRRWCRKFGQPYANARRLRSPRPGDQWPLDEVFLTINGATHYLWRAVDQAGHILDILVQRRRDRQAATRFFRQLLKGQRHIPRVLITDQLASYGAATREVLPSVEHRQHRSLNNRAENAHQPTRERARRMKRCTSPGHAQRFLAAHGPIASHCRPRRHRLTAAAYRQTRDQRSATWRAVTGTPARA